MIMFILNIINNEYINDQSLKLKKNVFCLKLISVINNERIS